VSARRKQSKTSPKGVSAPRKSSSALTPTNDFAALVERVATIIEEARSRVVRTVNSELVLSYWHIGREIVDYVQRGETRAEYEQVLERLSTTLRQRVGRGYSQRNLRNFRTFYQAFASRESVIRDAAELGGRRLLNVPDGDEPTRTQIRQIASAESALVVSQPEPSGFPVGSAGADGQLRADLRRARARAVRRADHRRHPCAQENRTIARYSVLSEYKQLFAAKYVTHLPSVEELERELARDRRLAEASIEPPNPRKVSPSVRQSPRQKGRTR